MDNIEIAEIFRTIAAAVYIAFDNYSNYGAYSRIANSIEAYTTPIEELHKEGRLITIPRVGSKSASILERILDGIPIGEIISDILSQRPRVSAQVEVPIPTGPYANKLDEEIIQTYQQSWDGISARNLARLANDLYSEMRSRGLLHITGSPLGQYQAMSDKELISLGRKKFQDVKRGELPFRTFGSSGYVKALQRRGLYRNVQPHPLSHGGKWKSRSDRIILRYYGRFYNGLSPTDVFNANRSLYEQLKVRKLLRFLPYQQRPWPDRNGLRSVYKENYDGLSRTQLFRADRWLYNGFHMKGMLGELPTRERWEKMTDDELKKFYHTHYDGLPRGKLKLIHNGFYRAVIRRGLIDMAPYSSPSPK